MDDQWKIVLDSGSRTCSLYILRIFLLSSILRHGANFQTLAILLIFILCYIVLHIVLAALLPIGWTQNLLYFKNKYAFNSNPFMVDECIRYKVTREDIRCNAWPMPNKFPFVALNGEDVIGIWLAAVDSRYSRLGLEKQRLHFQKIKKTTGAFMGPDFCFEQKLGLVGMLENRDNGSFFWMLADILIPWPKDWSAALSQWYSPPNKRNAHLPFFSLFFYFIRLAKLCLLVLRTL